MKFISWNVNGLRACMGKGFMESFNALNADFFCLQETKMQAGQLELDLPGYEQYWNFAQKKGYSGTAIFTRHKPLAVNYGVGVEELDTEGRLITLEYENFYLVTCYTPNAQRELARIDHRLRWEEALRAYLVSLDQRKPVVYCGDLNGAHNEMDLKNPTAAAPASPMKSAVHFLSCLKVVLLTHSATSTPIGQMLTLGGVICSAPGKRM